MIAVRVDNGVTTGVKIAAVFLAGWVASSWWYGTGSFEKVKQALPAAVSAANCERSLAGFNAKLAHAPIVLDAGQIPTDHCPKAPKVTLPETAQK